MNDQSIHDHYDQAWKMGYAAALDAAREVVSWTQDVDDAIDAIDVLRGM